MRRHSESANALACRLRRAALLGRVGAGRCEVCGTRCPPAQMDRFRRKPPTCCSGTCVEIALQRRAKGQA